MGVGGPRSKNYIVFYILRIQDIELQNLFTKVNKHADSGPAMGKKLQRLNNPKSKITKDLRRRKIRETIID